MSGFLEGLKALAGGFSDVRQIDQSGFDFREKRKAEQLARDQAAELARQEQEDWAAKAATEADLGGAEPGAIESMLPGNVNKALTLARMKGLGLQSKSSLETAKSQSKYYDRLQQGQQRQEEIAQRADEAESLARIRASIAAGQEPSPRDKYIAEEAAKRTGMTVEGMLSRAKMTGGGRSGGGGKPQRVTTERGIGWMYPPDAENPEGRFVLSGEQAPPTSVERTRREQAGNVMEQGQALLERLKGPVKDMIGPGAGWASSVKDIVGATPPEVRELKTDIASLAAFMPILHGARGGGNMITHFQDVIGNPFKYDADQIGASVYALMEAADRIQKTGPGADISDIAERYGFGRGGQSAIRPPRGGGQLLPGAQHGPAVQRKRNPDGTTFYRDAQGNVWKE